MRNKRKVHGKRRRSKKHSHAHDDEFNFFNEKESSWATMSSTERGLAVGLPLFIIILAAVGIALAEIYGAGGSGNGPFTHGVTRPRTRPLTNIPTEPRTSYSCGGGGALIPTYGTNGAFVVPNQGTAYQHSAVTAINPLNFDIFYYSWQTPNPFVYVTRMWANGTVGYNSGLAIGTQGLTAAAFDTIGNVFLGFYQPSPITSVYNSQLIKINPGGQLATNWPNFIVPVLNIQTSIVITSILTTNMEGYEFVYMLLSAAPDGQTSTFTITRYSGNNALIDLAFNPGVGYVQFTESKPNTEHFEIMELEKTPNLELSQVSRSFFGLLPPQPQREQAGPTDTPTDHSTDIPTHPSTAPPSFIFPVFSLYIPTNDSPGQWNNLYSS